MSHHSSFDDEQRKKMSALMREIFGEYPNGKLNAQDEGALALSVGREGSVVKIIFPKPVAWIGFTPEQAVALASDLLKHAKAAGLSAAVTLTLPRAGRS